MAFVSVMPCRRGSRSTWCRAQRPSRIRRSSTGTRRTGRAARARRPTPDAFPTQPRIAQVPVGMADRVGVNVDAEFGRDPGGSATPCLASWSAITRNRSTPTRSRVERRANRSSSTQLCGSGQPGRVDGTKVRKSCAAASSQPGAPPRSAVASRTRRRARGPLVTAQPSPRSPSGSHDRPGRRSTSAPAGTIGGPQTVPKPSPGVHPEPPRDPRRLHRLERMMGSWVKRGCIRRS